VGATASQAEMPKGFIVESVSGVLFARRWHGAETPLIALHSVLRATSPRRWRRKPGTMQMKPQMNADSRRWKGSVAWENDAHRAIQYQSRRHIGASLSASICVHLRLLSIGKS
jgi:hypothetical protein